VAYPKLSVIVANYNNEEYLQECIDSILEQTYQDIEIIIADDASTDNSQDIINTYCLRFPLKILSLYQKNNRGVSRNRHDAIMKSRGEYITTIDSDDVFYNKQKLENEMKLILFYKEVFNRDICAYSNTVNLDKTLTFLNVSTPKRSRKEGDIFIDILTRNSFIPRDFVFHKSYYLESDGYDDSLSIFEDWDLKIKIAQKLPFYFTGVYGTGYRQHESGLSSNHNIVQKKVILKNIFARYYRMISHSRDKKIALTSFNIFLNINYNTEIIQEDLV
jgi:glycosyltransferase involved in cell wall biosynthesis